jgi:hypothetical protein
VAFSLPLKALKGTLDLVLLLTFLLHFNFLPLIFCLF